MFRNILMMALRAIQRNMVRSILTMLGIVIGVGSVVALVTIGDGASRQVASQIGALGENLLTVRPGADRKPGGARQEAIGFELADVAVLASEVSGLDAVAPSSSSKASAIFGNANVLSNVTGTTDAYLKCRGYSILSGRNFSEDENRSRTPLCILGQTVIDMLFPLDDPVGQRIRIGKTSCTVIGTLKSKGEAAMGGDQDDVILMPIQAFQRRISGSDFVSSIEVSVNSNRTTSVVKNEIESLMRERRSISIGEDDDFHVRDMQEIVATMQESSAVLTILLSAIAAVSLLVGGIGIMNIMLVSVTERTREIGIRLAIGATGGEVMMQFLVEAAMLSGIGGAVGLLIGWGSAYIAATMLGIPFTPSTGVASLAFIFSVVVGITFGFLPAQKAARLNPMEALRYE